MDEKALLESLGGTYGEAPVVSAPAPTDTTVGKKPLSIKFKEGKTGAGKLLRGAGDLAVGFVKGAAETLGSVPKNVEKVVKDVVTTKNNKNYAELLNNITAQNNQLLAVMRTLPIDDPKREKYKKLLEQNAQQANALGEDFYGVGGVQEEVKKAGFTDKINEVTKAENKTQAFGKGAEKVAEFIAGGTAVAKAPGFLRATKAGNAGVRIAAKTAQGATGAGVGSLMSSATQGKFDTKEGAKNAIEEAGTAAAFGGGTSAVLAGGGELLKAAKIPSKLVANIYKTDKKEISQIFKEADDVAVQTGKKAPTVKLSQWAVDKGLKGNLETQAKQVQSILKSSEEKVIASAEAAKKTISIEKNLLKLAKKLQADFKDSGRGEIAKEADDFIKAIKDNTVSVKDALKFRRLLDSLRTKGSFLNNQSGDDVAYWADDLRKSVNAIDDIGTLNKDYAHAIMAREALIKAATSANNQNALGALEAYAIGFGGPTGVGIVAAKRATQSPNVRSKMAQVIQNGKPLLGVKLGIGKVAGDEKRKSQEKKKVDELLGNIKN